MAAGLANLLLLWVPINARQPHHQSWSTEAPRVAASHVESDMSSVTKPNLGMTDVSVQDVNALAMEVKVPALGSRTRLLAIQEGYPTGKRDE